MNPDTTRRLDNVAFLLTILAGAPYALGDIALAIPPAAKPWVFGIALLAKFILAEVKMRQTENK